MSRTAVFTVTLSVPTARTVQVGYVTVAGTATQPDDFTPVDGTLVFRPGETVKQIVVPIRDPVAAQAGEEFTVVLSRPVLATIEDDTGRCVLDGPNTSDGGVVDLDPGPDPDPGTDPVEDPDDPLDGDTDPAVAFASVTLEVNFVE